MAPKIPAVISCDSEALLEHELSIVRADIELAETEDNWNKISNAMLRLNAVVLGSAANYPTQLIAVCKAFDRPINSSLYSERSRLSGSATDLLATLAVHIGRPFESLIPLFVPTLLTLASRSNKIFIARAKSCLLSIAENCQSPALLPLLRHAVSDKSATLRLTATDLVLTCLNCYNPPDLEAPNRAKDIEAVIRATARDASAEVRKSSRKVFEAYKILLPSRVDMFIAPLTPVRKKYLDIKAAAVVQHRPLLLSTSTSVPTLPPAAQSKIAPLLSRPPVRTRAKSTSVGSDTTSHAERTSTTAKPPTNPHLPERVDVPFPPQRMPSTGPIRPPPSMRQAVAVAAALTLSRRPLFRHNFSSSSSSVFDATMSQPLPHGGVQRPLNLLGRKASSTALDVAQRVPSSSDLGASTKGPFTTGPRRVPKPGSAPNLESATTQDNATRDKPYPRGGAQRPLNVPARKAPSSASNVAKHVSSFSDLGTSTKGRSVTGPRRVPKPESVPKLVPAITQDNKPTDVLKESVKENVKEAVKEGVKNRERGKKQLASSTSTVGMQASQQIHSRPPSRLASSTNSQVEEGKCKGRLGKSSSRAVGEFYPRPALKIESAGS